MAWAHNTRSLDRAEARVRELRRQVATLTGACQAVLRALEHEAAENGTVVWMVPPDQSEAVHESAVERLQNALSIL